MEVLKNNLEVKTKTKQLEDIATGDKGITAYRTFLQKDEELSNDYIIPYHAIDHIVVKNTVTTETVDDDTCRSDAEPPTPPGPTKPEITGADDITINQGVGIDLTDGVKAYDGEGNEIPFAVNPTEIDKCDVGEHEVTYTADGVEVTRKITITAISDPTITGLTDLIVEVNEEFDPLEGVTAKDGNGNDIDVEVVEEEPTEEILLTTTNATINVEADEYTLSDTVSQGDMIRLII